MKTIFGNLQKLGKAIMLPVAVLPAAALLLRLGAPDVFDIPFIMKAGGAIFDNLPLIFAIGIAIGFSFDNGGSAGLAGAIGYLTLTSAVVTINADINMGVLAGIISGITAGLLYNRYHSIKLPDFLGFFGGKRFVPIATAVVSIAFAFVLGFIWPPVQNLIHRAGVWMVSSGPVGAFSFGFLNRLLIPLGLHHVLNSMAWFVFGDFTNAAGQLVTGDLPRFFAGDPTAGTFMTGFFPIMMFALPAAALAMYTTARTEERRAVGGILLSVALTALLTGITEPLEFAFMFLAPVLYFFHALLTGAALAICSVMGIHAGFGFSAGAIDYFLNWGLATKPLEIVPIGLAFAAIYYFLFVFFIRKFDLPTPGRIAEDRDIAPPGKEAASGLGALARSYVEKLGGRENIQSVDACITRLRLTLRDADRVTDSELESLGAKGVIRATDRDLQVVIGTRAERVADEIRRILS